MNLSPLDITGCTVGHAIRAGRWLVLLILLAPDLRSSVPSVAPAAVGRREGRRRLGSVPLASTTRSPCPRAPLLYGENLSPPTQPVPLASASHPLPLGELAAAGPGHPLLRPPGLRSSVPCIRPVQVMPHPHRFQSPDA